MDRPPPPRLRVGYVPGVTLTKWRRIWGERFPRNTLVVVEVPEAGQRAALVEDEVDLCFVRLPIERAGLHLIPLYQEVPVVVSRADSPISLFDQVTTADLADEELIEPDHPDAIDLVAGGAGLLRVPQSVARTHSRRDLVHRPVTDAPATEVGLAWRVDSTAELVEDFIGVVRGRTVNSSRTRQGEPKPTPTPAATRQPRTRANRRRRGR